MEEKGRASLGILSLERVAGACRGGDRWQLDQYFFVSTESADGHRNDQFREKSTQYRDVPRIF